MNDGAQDEGHMLAIELSDLSSSDNRSSAFAFNWGMLSSDATGQSSAQSLLSILTPHEYPDSEKDYAHVSLTMLCHGLTFSKSSVLVDGDEMIETESCYRVSVLSGSLEISARLKSADDLELLVRVLEANKALFSKADKLEPQILMDADRPATKLSTTQSETQALVKADRPKAKMKANGSARKFLTEVD
jgi:hypothetical protein